MNSRDWYRDDDYYRIRYDQCWGLERLGIMNIASLESFNWRESNSVRFRKNFSNTIKQITVTRTFKGDITIKLTPADGCYESFYRACHRLLENVKFEIVINSPHTSTNSVTIPLNTLGILRCDITQDAINQLTNTSIIIQFNSIDVIEKIRRIAPSDITQNVVAELTNIFNYDPTNLKPTDKHIVPHGNCLKSWTNPARKDSMKLITEMQRINSEIDANKIPSKTMVDDYHGLLLKGENVHQHEDGKSALWYALFNDHIIFLSLLLQYGANPLMRFNGYHFKCARADALIHKRSQHLRLIDEATFPSPEFLFKTPKNKLVITETVSDAKQIITTFKFPRQPIVAQLTRMNKLTPEVVNIKEKLYEFFKTYFTDPDENKIRSAFEDAFECDQNKFVERIYDANKKLIGFNNLDIFEVQGTIILHCAYSAIDSEHQGQGLMPILAFRLAFSLQDLYPQKVAIFFSPMELSAYSLMDMNSDLLHVPKYQSDHMPSLMDAILMKIYKGKLPEIIHRQSIWGVIEEYTLKVRTTKLNRPKNSFLASFFDNYIKCPESKDMIPVSLVYVSDESFKKFHDCAYNLGINSVDLTSQQAKALRPFVEAALGKKCPKREPTRTAVRLFDHNALLWQNEANDASVPLNSLKQPDIASRV